jgi:hypothetical protein
LARRVRAFLYLALLQIIELAFQKSVSSMDGPEANHVW